MNDIGKAIGKAEQGHRLSFGEARTLFREAGLHTLGQLAQATRFRLNPDNVVTYAVDRNINYTNICVSKCRFCAFHRGKDDAESYVLDDATLATKLEETRALGGTHILFQGGHNPDLDMVWHEERIRFIRSYGLRVHGYSPTEITFFSETAGISVREVLERFMEAGLNSVPGGGGEILHDRVRRMVSPGKANARQWLKVMETAHELGLKTTATMMFGHVEKPEELLAHLFLLRRLQDKTSGFTSFIPWPYQPGPNTIEAPPTGGPTYLRTLAIARLVLDNFQHAQASWVTQGPDIGQVALLFGADDLGSTMIEENVVAAAGVGHRLSREQMIRLIRGAGFGARQRDNLHDPVEAN